MNIIHNKIKEITHSITQFKIANRILRQNAKKNFHIKKVHGKNNLSISFFNNNISAYRNAMANKITTKP